MNGNSPFDGNAAFSGGGFMPSQATQTADPTISPAKNRDAMALLPLTVKQISEACEASDGKADFQIDGVDVHNVKLVGMLYEKTERITDVSFVIDDGTGRVPCNKWINEPVDTKEMELLENGMYVKVHGNLKGFQGKKQLVIYSIRPVTEYNEIANHFAECIYVHCYNTRLRKVRDAGHVPGHMSNSAINTPSKSHLSTPSNHFSVQRNMDEVKGVEKHVFNYLQQPSCIPMIVVAEKLVYNARERGVHRNELAQQLKIPEHKIAEAIESLVSEGLIYSTIDDDHYQSAANG